MLKLLLLLGLMSNLDSNSFRDRELATRAMRFNLMAINMSHFVQAPSLEFECRAHWVEEEMRTAVFESALLKADYKTMPWLDMVIQDHATVQIYRSMAAQKGVQDNFQANIPFRERYDAYRCATLLWLMDNASHLTQNEITKILTNGRNNELQYLRGHGHE